MRRWGGNRIDSWTRQNGTTSLPASMLGGETKREAR